MVNKNQRTLLSKMVTGNGHGENSPYFDGWKAFEDNPFHPTDNPHGVIQMGLAENQVTKIYNFLSVHFINLKYTQESQSLVALYIYVYIHGFYVLFNLQLSFDLVEEWLMKNPEASICTPEGVNDFRDITIFQDYHGLTKFRNVSNRLISYI